jgi:uncharacterized protein YukE
MGIFNDIDDWFMDRVHKIVKWLPEEQKLYDKLNSTNAKIETTKKAVEDYDNSENGKRRSKLATRRNKTSNNAGGGRVLPLTAEETVQLKGMEAERAQLTRKRDALKDFKKKLETDLAKLQSLLKRDSESYYYAIEQHWKANGKSKAAYHGGKWNGKDARDAMKDPEKYYSEMKNVLLRFKADTTTNETIGLLLNDVVELLRIWYKVFRREREARRMLCRTGISH